MYKKKQRIVCIIPARLAATRFPEKMLTTLGDQPLLSIVWNAAHATNIFDDIFFAIDHERTAALIESFGGRYFMTSATCPSGTDRLVELMIHGKVEADIWVNWQGDEPFINKPMVQSLLQSCNNSNEEMWSLKKRIDKSEEIFAPNIAKVVTNAQGCALYFSRAPIPYFRDEHDQKALIKKNAYFKHVGLYAYTTQALRKISVMKQCYTEDAEKLEQLRFLHYGLTITIHETDQDVRGIDTPADLIAAEERIRGNQR